MRKISNLLETLDKYIAHSTRRSARTLSRRNVITRFGQLLVGTALIPVLPVARASAPSGAIPEIGDPASCDYWRYCAIDGYLCSCCGGSSSSCPPGAEPSPVTWVGTCENPADGKRYIISYNDCCGKATCGKCFCNRNEGDKPIYYPPKSNDINWCIGTKSNAYHCSTAVVVGLDDS
ncbi:MAG: methylamine dehydrogenase light chain [Pseudomonadales bacterium]